MKKTIKVTNILSKETKMEIEINNDCGVIVKLIKYDKVFNNLIQDFILYKDKIIVDNYKKVSSAELVNMIMDSLETLTEGVIAIMELNCVVNVN
jgi:hypothetical protein